MMIERPRSGSQQRIPRGEEYGSAVRCFGRRGEVREGCRMLTRSSSSARDRRG
jgi:hypothetical protein